MIATVSYLHPQMMEAPPVDPAMRLAAVVKAVGLSPATIYRRIAAKEFPESFSLGGKARGWRQSAIKAWLDARETAGAR